MFSCLSSDAEQTSVTSCQTMLGISRLSQADSVSRLVTGYMCEVLQYGICRRYYVTVERR